jgi:hypothetical protein
MNIMGISVWNNLFTISKELIKTLWACCIPKGLFPKAIVLMGTNGILFIKYTNEYVYCEIDYIGNIDDY